MSEEAAAPSRWAVLPDGWRPWQTTVHADAGRGVRKGRTVADYQSDAPQCSVHRGAVYCAGAGVLPMRVDGLPRSDYRVLVSRGWTRPRAQLHAFGVRQAIPTIPVPLVPREAEPELRLNDVLHALYERARFDLRVRYDRPPEPPLGDEDAAWARGLVTDAR